MPSIPAGLYIVATPLGNPGDISTRAKHILANATLVLAEDTRRAAALYRSIGVAPNSSLSFHEHNEKVRQEKVLAALRNGQSVALISDAGTPLLADPGFRLVRACRKEGLRVSPIPGPTAVVAAISASGVAPIPYTFLGFLPRSRAGIADLFSSFSRTPGSLVFFERKDRLKASLAIIHDILGGRELVICRELTKTYEEFILTRLEDYDALPDEIRGEITVIIGPPAACGRSAEAEVKDIIDEFEQPGRKPREVARLASRQCIGWSTAEVYRLLLSVKRRKNL